MTDKIRNQLLEDIKAHSVRTNHSDVTQQELATLYAMLEIVLEEKTKLIEINTKLLKENEVLKQTVAKQSDRFDQIRIKYESCSTKKIEMFAFMVDVRRYLDNPEFKNYLISKYQVTRYNPLVKKIVELEQYCSSYKEQESRLKELFKDLKHLDGLSPLEISTKSSTYLVRHLLDENVALSDVIKEKGLLKKEIENKNAVITTLDSNNSALYKRNTELKDSLKLYKNSPYSANVFIKDSIHLLNNPDTRNIYVDKWADTAFTSLSSEIVKLTTTKDLNAVVSELLNMIGDLSKPNVDMNAIVEKYSFANDEKLFKNNIELERLYNTIMNLAVDAYKYKTIAQLIR